MGGVGTTGNEPSGHAGNATSGVGADGDEFFGGTGDDVVEAEAGQGDTFACQIRRDALGADEVEDAAEHYAKLAAPILNLPAD